MASDRGGPGWTILLVDDSSRIRPLVREILRDLQCRILEADGADQALELAAVANIDLLLTDITMPGMNGVELANTLRLRYPKMQVLYMSGYALPSLISKDMHFIEKPFQPDALLRKVRAMFGPTEQA
jgi:CheY-like chemotaxis protein